MTTLMEARAELRTALEADGLRVTESFAGLSAPSVLMLGDGIDLGHLLRGEVGARVRLVLVAGAWDGAGAAGILAGLVATVLGVLRSLAGWRVDDVSPDSTVRLQGSTYAAVDITTTRSVTI